jgi:TPP-dependent indolepyruvate ferredoxin oxidoreductase alpha subunit
MVRSRDDIYRMVELKGKKIGVTARGSGAEFQLLDMLKGAGMSGSDVTIVSFGIGMTYALEAADILAKDGISAEVIDLRTLRPIDYDTVLASVQKTNRCVTVEEGFPVGSIGDHMASTIMQRAFDYLDAPVVTCTGKDVPMPYAKQIEKLIIESGVEPYDKKVNQGYWRIVLYRESKKTKQVLISVIVSDGYLLDEEKQKWIE